MINIYQKYRPFYKDNLKLAIPVVISQLGHTTVQLADSIVVGHFAGTDALAAVSLVNAIFMITMVVGLGISYGITPLIAQYNGIQNHDECGLLLSNSLLTNVVTGIILFTSIYFGSMLAINHLDQSPEVVILAKPYLLLLSISVIPLLVFNTFKQFAEGLGFTKQAMKISIWGNVLNICFAVTFVKGLFGVQPMGIKGVGYSTLIDRFLMAAVMSFYIFRLVHFKKYLVKFRLFNIDRQRIAQILAIGVPVALQAVFEISAFGAANIMIGTIGPVPQAAHQVAINLASLTYMMASGISAAAAIRSGNHFGAKNFKALRLSAITSYHIVLIFMSITAILFIAANHVLPWIFTSDKAVITIASQLIIIAGIFQLFDGAQVVGLGILRGMGDVLIPTTITFIAYWLLGLPVGYLLGIRFNLGVYGIWYGLLVGLLSAALLLFLRFNVISKKHQYHTSLILAQD
jgi:MATE family multidrug resistance protein